MHAPPPSRRAAPGSALFCWLLLASAPGAGQPADPLARLQRLHDTLARPDTLLSAAQGRQALRDLHQLALDRQTLDAPQAAQALRVEIYATLAVGDARGAARHLTRLAELFPTAPETAQAEYLVASALGDATRAGRALKRLRPSAPPAARRHWSRRRRWLRSVAARAPVLSLSTADGKSVRLAQRDGTVLLIDFWSTLFPPADAHLAAMRALYQQHARGRKLELLGVNTDSPSRLNAARQLAHRLGYVWPQHYQATAASDPPVSRALRAGTPPWDVLIDQFGYVRAVGTPAEPALRYALRAAVAEAEGRYDPVALGPAAAAPAERSAQPQPRPAGRLPSNAYAAQKLRLARTYLKTGRRRDAIRLFEEIVKKYPGTRQAKIAQEYLESLK